ncbi:serine/threonine-protein kinase [Kitasatospora aureofaciens]|uniref:serine/threonine-protein kinase n=1 Tax=Kitasatospora aureofaciens TaxID=1894 RepID=UPI0037C8D3CC
MHVGDLIAGRYELLKRLGRGGMGEVWAARDRRLHRDVALKVLALGDDVPPELARRFDREAVAAAQINHPNVAVLYDCGRHEDLLFLVMEKVDGGPLGEHLRSRPVLAPSEALALAEGICSALAAAHAAGVVHYDIKPHNVMLTPEGQVKVVDFGIAGFLQTAFTLAHSSQLTPAGTPEYGAPEQFLAERGDARSDLYALGGLLFTMLTGQAPFTGPNAMAVVRRKLDEDAPRLDVLRPDLPAALVDLVATLLATDPAERLQTAPEVLRRLRDLQTALASGTVPVAVVAHKLPDIAEPHSAVRLNWNSDVSLKSYAKMARVGRLWLVFLALVSVPALMIYLLNRSYPSERSGLLVFLVLVSFALCGIPAAVMVLFPLPYLTFQSATDARARQPGAPWGLLVDSRGITVTSEAGSETFTWPTVTRVAVEPIPSPSPHKYTGVILDLDPTGPPHALLRPAGWHYPVRYLPMDPRTRVPVCVLGPTTERQRRQLIHALITHAGLAWNPKTVFTTLPVDGQ